MGLNVLIITDAFYHYKNLYYFQKYNFFSIGLVSAAMSPDKVSYAVAGLSNNFFTQNFFFKTLILLKRLANANKVGFYQD